MERLIYLDNNATTPLDPLVLDAMLPYFTHHFGNASSISHAPGRRASEAVEKSREQVAALIGAAAREVTFTSGATEAINMVLKGIFEHYQIKGKHIITAQSEHKAVLDVCAYLTTKGAEITYLPVNQDGHISLDDLRSAIREDTILITLMYANNETGVIHPIDEVAQIATAHDVLFFCDATQAFGKLALDVAKTPIDILCLSAHKLYGPKGIGAVYIRRKRKPIQTGALLHGGGQEHKLRAGTLNVPAIVGLGEAAALANKSLREDANRLKALRDKLESSLLMLPETVRNGDKTNRLPHVSNISFRHLKASEIMVSVPDIALASGSACVSGDRDPSHVLLSMGLSAEEAHASLRFSLGRFTMDNDIDETISQVTRAVEKLRASSPVWQLFEAGLID